MNIMSINDDKCFQCQQSRHMAHHCPCIKCFDCDEYGHVAADCPNKIPPSGMPARHRNASSNTRHHNRSTSCNTFKLGIITMIIKTDIGLAGQDPIPTVIDTGVTVKSNLQRSQSRSYHWPTHCSTSHHRNSSRYCYWQDTPHRRPSSHRSFFRDRSRSRPCASHKYNCKTSSKWSYSSDQTAWKNKNRKYKQVTIDDPPSKYYSSDEQSSKSNEDLN